MIIKNKKNRGKLEGVALFEILVLIISIIAFSYFIGEEFRVVSAKMTNEETTGEYEDCQKNIVVTVTTFDGNSVKWAYTGKGNLWQCVTNNCGEHKNKVFDLCKYYSDPKNQFNIGKCINGVFKCKKRGSSLEKSNQVDANKGNALIPTYNPNIGNKDLCTSQGGECVAESQCDLNTHIIYKSSAGEEVCPSTTSKLVCCIPTKKTTEKEREEIKNKYGGYDECIKTAKTKEEKEECEKKYPAEKAPFGLEENLLGIGGFGYFVGHLAEGAAWAVGVYIGIKTIGPMLGLEESLVNAAAWSIGGGVLAGKIMYGIIQWGARGRAGAGATWAGIGVGAVAAALIFWGMYRHEDQEVITFTCQPWQAPTRGSHCEECNKQGILPCSEYQCRSLGQGCELLNKGTDQEKCAWVNKKDVDFPIIKPWKDALLKGYEYTPDNTISPPDRGVKIEYSPAAPPRCVKAFTPLSFGVSLNEPAKCKIDTTGKKSFDEMRFLMSGGLSLYNHSYSLSLPGSAALESENITIQNDGEYELYIRCQDANGNSNTANFVFKFCVETGPDTTPPLIAGTSIPSGNPIAFNQTSANIEVYVNEPAECRWSHLDQSYDNMENKMNCSSSIFEMNAQMLYTCKTTLTGLKDKTDNNFYFRCKDSSDNVNTESYKYTLVGTQPLIIDWVKPNRTIKDSTDTVKVTIEAQTSAGYKEGEANCYYSETGDAGSYILFLNTNSYQHSQDLWLPEGSYKYYIKCIDLGGNTDNKTVTFNVETDSSPPIVTRAYHEETYLKLVTNEPARCVYDTKYENYPCDYAFEDGLEMKALDNVNHYIDWNTQLTLYIKCQDEFGNQPAPNECSIIVRPSNEYSQNNS